MKKSPVGIIIFILFFVGAFISFIVGYAPGKAISLNFYKFIIQMIKVLPAVFLLIGLFNVWVKKETIEKHLGKGGGIKSYIWVFVLAAPMAGGLFPALPIGYELYKKGARFSVIFAFLGAVGIGRVPMVLFESSFLGWKFSVLRLSISIPLVIITSVLMGKYFDKIEYEIPDKKVDSENQ